MIQQIEIERRWILVDLIDLEEINQTHQKLRLTQHYLINPDGFNERVRQIITADHQISFINTIKTPAKVGQLEREVELTSAEYIKALTRVDLKRHVVVKDRYVFPFGDLKLEVDQFIHPGKFRILELEVPSLEAEITVPDFLGRTIEITNTKGLSNYSLALNPKEVQASIQKIKDAYLSSSNHFETSLISS